MKISDEAKEYLAHFGPITQEIYDYATNDLLRSSRYIIVRSTREQQYGYCTYCNNEFRTHLPKPTDRTAANLEMCGCAMAVYAGAEHERLKMGEGAECPVCHSACYVRYEGVSRNRLYDSAYLVYYEKSVMDPKIIVARGFLASRDYSDSYKNVQTNLTPEVFYVFRYGKGGRMVKTIAGWPEPHMGIARKVHSWASRHLYKICCYNKSSIEEAVKGTPFAWSGWEQYDDYERIKFFDLYSRYPVVEYLTKVGHKNIVEEKLKSGSTAYGAINWRGKTIESFFRLSSEEYSIIKQNKIEITSLFLYFIKLNKEKALGLSIPEVKTLSQNCMMHGEGEIDGFIHTFKKHMNFRDAFKYCMKQYNKRIGTYYSLNSVERDWRDYVEECKKLNMNTDDMRVLFPNDLHKAHQNTTVQIKYAEDKALTERIIARLPHLSYYQYQSQDYIIRPAASSFELVEEGKVLCHCVGRYAKDYAEGKTDILFVRQTASPDVP